MSNRRPQIERLNEETWSRIKRNVFAQLDAEEAQRPIFDPRIKRRLLPVWAFALSGAAAAILVTLLVRRPNPPAIAQVAAPSRIVTDTSGTHVSYGELGLDVAAQSALVVSGDDEHGRLVVLDRGSVTCEVAPRHGRPPFVVQAGDVRVTVVGTRFSVSRNEESATVSVEHGTVEIASPTERVLVTGGESWPKPAAPVVEEPAPPAKPTRQHKPTAQTQTQTQTQTRTPTQTWTRTRTEERTPTEQPAPTEKPTVPVTPPAAPGHNNVREQRYEYAAQLEARDPQQSITIYRVLAAGDDAWAQNALYAYGRLEADRHHRSEALRLLREYLDRFPQGVNARDARQLIDKLR